MSAPTTKVVLVTGASSGIGEATVRELLGAGHRVYAAARRVEKMTPLEEAGACVRFVDVTEEEAMTRLVNEILETEERLDVLVNNAGFGLYGAVEEISIDEARHQFEVNLFGLARMTQLAIPPMRARRSGTIVNISSVGGKVYTPMGSWYHASKHALEGWSDSLRLEVAPFGIDVVVIEPGAIETEFGEAAIVPLLKRSLGGPYQDMAEKMARATRDTYSSGRASQPEVIASVVRKAIESSRPRTRYAAGFLAKPLLFTRKLISDRLFDWMIRKAL